MTIEPNGIRKLILTVMHIKPEEIGCDDCYDHMDRFAEMIRNGVDASQVLPLVKDHLAICPPCREEFEALLKSLESND